MKSKNVGKIKNINYDSKTNKLEVTVTILDNKFKKKLLRDLSLDGYIYFESNKLFYRNIKKEKD